MGRQIHTADADYTASQANQHLFCHIDGLMQERSNSSALAMELMYFLH